MAGRTFIFREIPKPPPMVGRICEATWDILTDWKQTEDGMERDDGGRLSFYLEGADVGFLTGVRWASQSFHDDEVQSDCYRLIEAIRKYRQIELAAIFEIEE